MLLAIYVFLWMMGFVVFVGLATMLSGPLGGLVIALLILAQTVHQLSRS